MFVYELNGLRIVAIGTLCLCNNCWEYYVHDYFCMILLRCMLILFVIDYD